LKPPHVRNQVPCHTPRAERCADFFRNVFATTQSARSERGVSRAGNSTRVAAPRLCTPLSGARRCSCCCHLLETWLVGIGVTPARETWNLTTLARFGPACCLPWVPPHLRDSTPLESERLWPGLDSSIRILIESRSAREQARAAVTAASTWSVDPSSIPFFPASPF